MSSKISITNSTQQNSDKIDRLANAIKEADAIIIGAGAGLSTSAGFEYSGPRFTKYFDDFSKKYHIQDMYTGSFHVFPTPEEQWAFLSRLTMVNRFEPAPKSVYKDLFELVKNKNYFVITTNVDHQFQLANFDKSRLFYTQGDYGLFQCSVPCQQKTYDNETVIRDMYTQQKDMKIPSSLVPKCPNCGKPMTLNLRCDSTFVEDDGWHAASARYSSFLESVRGKKVLFLELGVGANTPGIIKYPFWRMTLQNPNAIYACLSLEAFCPAEIGTRSICIEGDIGLTLTQVTAKVNEKK